MKIVMNILLLTLSTYAFGNAQEPVPPRTEAPYSQEVRDRSSGTRDTFGRMSWRQHPNGKWAYDLTIENVNDSPIRCFNTYFNASLDFRGNSCQNPDYTTLIAIGDGKNFIDIPAKSQLKFTQLGYDERVKREQGLVNRDDDEESNDHLEFCRRDPINLDCGFDCPNGRKFGEDWGENGDWGSVKAECQRDGTPLYTNLKCNTNYVPSADGSRCEALVCSEGYEPINSICSPKSCTAYFNSQMNTITHGGQMTQYTTGGYKTWSCNLGKIAINLSCEAPSYGPNYSLIPADCERLRCEVYSFPDPFHGRKVITHYCDGEWKNTTSEGGGFGFGTPLPPKVSQSFSESEKKAFCAKIPSDQHAKLGLKTSVLNCP